MDKEVKAEWVEALRSGEFEQGRQFLRTQGGEYCCLGVLSELSVRRHIIEMHTDKDGITQYDGYFSYLPEALRDLFSISSEETDILMRMNDVDKSSFEHIADWIEANM